MEKSKGQRYYFRANEEEEILIERKFSNSGLKSKSEFFRQMILQGYLLTMAEEDVEQIETLLKNIANNINQIALVANRSGNVYREDLQEIQKELNKIWQQQNYIRSKVQKVERSLT